MEIVLSIKVLTSGTNCQTMTRHLKLSMFLRKCIDKKYIKNVKDFDF